MSTQSEVVGQSGASTAEPLALTEAGRALATSLGIAADPTYGESWPIDVGQRSIAADFDGSVSGEIYLSLADSEADRLLTDHEGAAEVFRDLLASLGVDPASVETSPFRPADGLPATHVVVRDENGILGLGLLMRDAPAAGAPSASDAAAFEPSPIAGSTPHPTGSLGAPISQLADRDMVLTVELGRTTLPVRELLSLQPGMVVELERQAGAPIDVLVNGRLIARGEVVVLDEQFGLRVTEIVSDVVGGR